MPEVICTTVYQFPELSDAAKEKARSWYRELGPYDDWWDAVYEDFERVCDILGVSLKTRPVRLMGGGTREKPCIWFSGFWSQGDGAAFEGYLSHAKGATTSIRDYAPQDTTLHGIADRLQAIQRRNFYQLAAEAGWAIVERHGHTAAVAAIDALDATVAYPHVDLRIAPTSPVVLSARVRGDVLVVSAWATKAHDRTVTIERKVSELPGIPVQYRVTMLRTITVGARTERALLGPRAAQHVGGAGGVVVLQGLVVVVFEVAGIVLPVEVGERSQEEVPLLLEGGELVGVEARTPPALLAGRRWRRHARSSTGSAGPAPPGGAAEASPSSKAWATRSRSACVAVRPPGR